MDTCNVQTGLKQGNCTGCGLCVTVCPYNAVVLNLNEYGIPVRSVLGEKCINCGKCVKYCPQINPICKSEPVDCFAEYPNENNHSIKYSSGGAATLIARAFIQKMNGYVCGCIWDTNDRKAKHIIVNNENELYRFCGSKYVQSDVGNSFGEIKKLIEQKEYVLFIGTPCQVAAMRKYTDSPYLFTIDLICHGTPPASYLKEYIDLLPKSNQISSISFRGEYDFWLTLWDKNSNLIRKTYKDDDPYFNAFLKGTFYRENCYECQYAQLNRVGDVTLGDFWGLERSGIQYKGNISLILTNNDKGYRLVSLADDIMKTERRSLEEAVKGNLQLSAPMAVSDDCKRFYENMRKSNDFISAFKQTDAYSQARISHKKRKKYEFICRVKSRIKELIGGNI